MLLSYGHRFNAIQSDTGTWICYTAEISSKNYCRPENVLRSQLERQQHTPRSASVDSVHCSLCVCNFSVAREKCKKWEMRKLCRSVIIAICYKENRSSSIHARVWDVTIFKLWCLCNHDYTVLTANEFIIDGDNVVLTWHFVLSTKPKMCLHRIQSHFPSLNKENDFLCWLLIWPRLMCR